jgi:hypothetical protein
METETEIFNEEMYRRKKIFFENRKKEEEKYLTRKEDKSQFLKHLNLEVYPEKYKFKEHKSVQNQQFPIHIFPLSDCTKALFQSYNKGRGKATEQRQQYNI